MPLRIFGENLGREFLNMEEMIYESEYYGDNEFQGRRIMPPPWMVCPYIRRSSVGWRTGFGGAYAEKFQTWLKMMTPKKRKSIGKCSRNASPGKAGGTEKIKPNFCVTRITRPAYGAKAASPSTPGRSSSKNGKKETGGLSVTSGTMMKKTAR